MPRAKMLYRSARFLAIVYILFLSLFALDVIEPGRSIWEILGGLLMHLIPNFILAAVLVLAWKWERIGGVIFILLAAGMFYFFRNPFWLNIGLFSPVVLIGSLFIIGSILEKGN